MTNTIQNVVNQTLAVGLTGLICAFLMGIPFAVGIALALLKWICQFGLIICGIFSFVVCIAIAILYAIF